MSKFSFPREGWSIICAFRPWNSKVPSSGWNVENACSAIRGRAFVNFARRDDLPEFGKPIRTNWNPSFLILLEDFQRPYVLELCLSFPQGKIFYLLRFGRRDIFFLR